MSDYNQGPSPEGQNPYGAQPPGQPQYGQQPYGYATAPDHPQTTMILILGILSVVLCQLIGPVAWVMGNRVVREIDASQGQLGGRSTANIGRILGIVGSVLLILSIVLIVVVFAIAIGGATSFS